MGSSSVSVVCLEHVSLYYSIVGLLQVLQRRFSEALHFRELAAWQALGHPGKITLGHLEGGQSRGATSCRVQRELYLVVQGHRVAETIPEGFFPPYSW